jgi:hypothetical protein
LEIPKVSIKIARNKQTFIIKLEFGNQLLLLQAIQGRPVGLHADGKEEGEGQEGEYHQEVVHPGDSLQKAEHPQEDSRQNSTQPEKYPHIKLK